MKILAIDPGFGRLGVAVLERGVGERLLFSECFETDPKADFLTRIGEIGQRVGWVIKKFKPKAAAIETLFFSGNQKTAMRVAEARGAILYEVGRTHIPVFEYSPLQVKTALTSYGKADKPQIEFMVSKILSLDLSKKKDDEVDAIAIGLTHFSHHPTLTKRR